MIALVIILWLALAVTAYPRHKKWRRESRSVWNASRGKRWTNDRMIGSMLASLFGWYLIWIYFLLEKMEQLWDRLMTSNPVAKMDNWSERDATFDRNVVETFKRIIGKK